MGKGDVHGRGSSIGFSKDRELSLLTSVMTKGTIPVPSFYIQ